MNNGTLLIKLSPIVKPSFDKSYPENKGNLSLLRWIVLFEIGKGMCSLLFAFRLCCCVGLFPVYAERWRTLPLSLWHLTGPGLTLPEVLQSHGHPELWEAGRGFPGPRLPPGSPTARLFRNRGEVVGFANVSL